jgi:lysozyme
MNLAAIISILAAILILILITLYLGNREINKALPGTSDYEEYGTAVPKGNYKYGIDISHHNNQNIKWSDITIMTDRKGHTVTSLKKAKNIYPVSFVIMKATEGMTMKDRKFEKWWQDAGKAGITRGAYHFFRSSKNPGLQARLFIRTVGPLDENDLPPILDLETIHRGCSNKTLNSRALKWLEYVGNHYKRKPIVYTSTYFVKNVLDNNITGHYPIWISDFRGKEPEIKDWYIWQFTDNAVVFGIQGPVDLDVMKNNY